MESKTEGHMTSAAAFVEGGIQESCDDACSICLEEFCESDPSTVTVCRHEFHLQCILEWCQRSSQCPMCWQNISLKDPTSQELFEGVEHERRLRETPSRNAAIFHHPALGDFDLQHLSMGVNDGDFEERLIQHLAAAAAMRRHHLVRREGQRTRSSAQGHPHFLVFSTQPIASPLGPDSAAGGGNEPAVIPVGSPSTPIAFDGDEPSQQISHIRTQRSSSSSGSGMATNRQGIYSSDRGSAAPSSPASQDRAGPSELQSFSDSLRSKLNSVSMRYKESISKGARGWKERLFSRSSSMSEPGSEARSEVNAEIASVSQLMESLETRKNTRVHSEDGGSMAEVNNQSSVEARGDNSPHHDNSPAACSASSHSS
ncbi:E3 ubiquitin-protein ligase RHF2A-like isoform X2 [Lotus japonicus]|nr:E3 ubiquitin-protein ligase RHF2A-like isoform X2 [Lotus japonicus]XP_057438951.1 E3 ubiquitin-protein ligase RHF2A-like isoform X2 [Lotus japonicus]